MFERRLKRAGIPLLALAPDDKPRPAVLFYHGLHSHKDTHRKELEQLAQAGFLALGVDAVGHGERPMDDLRGFLKQGPFLGQVLKLVRPSLEEVPLLVDFLTGHGFGPVGLCGISFGALLAYGVIPREPRLRAVAAILGDPSWCEPWKQREAYRRTPLIAWNGGSDQHVDHRPARDFMADHPHRASEYYEFPESDHFMRPEDWAAGWGHTLRFFTRHLS